MNPKILAKYNKLIQCNYLKLNSAPTDEMREEYICIIIVLEETIEELGEK